MKQIFCVFCALILFACSSDDEPSGKVTLTVDGKSSSMHAYNVMGGGYFDYNGNFGLIYGGESERQSFYFTHAPGRTYIDSPEYYPEKRDYDEYQLAYRPVQDFESNIELETDTFIKGTFSGEFVNPQGDSKQISGRFKVYK